MIIDVTAIARRARIVFYWHLCLIFLSGLFALERVGFFFVGTRIKAPGIPDFVQLFLINAVFVAALILLTIMGYSRKYWLSIAAVSLAFGLFWCWTLITGFVFGDYIKWIRNDISELATQILPVFALAAVPIGLSVFAYRLSRSILHPIGKKLTFILNAKKRIDRKPGGLAPPTGSPRQIFGNFLVGLSLAGIIVVVILNQLSFVFLTDPAIGELLDDYSFKSLFFLPLFGFANLIGRRLAQPDAWKLLKQDKRPPVVLLRSFSDDQRVVASRNPAKRLLYFGLGNKSRLEDVIADDFRLLGPFVAIGQPGERLPPLGAARAYIIDEGNFEDAAQWQTRVLNWLDEASLIVLIAGTTPGVLWELSRIIDGGHIIKLLILLPPTKKEEKAEVWRRLTEAFDGTPWKLPLRSLDHEQGLALFFEEGGGLTLIRGNPRSAVDYELAVRVACYGMANPLQGESTG